MSNYKLRPHHGLCIQFFRGEGYNQEFIENMQEIVDALAANPIIELVNGADSVCHTCPNRIGETDCACDEKVLHYDKKVMEYCKLTCSSTLTWNEFSSKIYNYILTPDLREDICGDCEWNALCQFPLD